MAVLVTGGAGYIGSHTILSLLKCNDIVVLDNLTNASIVSLNRVTKLINKDLVFYHGDIQDAYMLRRIFYKHDIKDVIHFAGLKSVNESILFPLEYYKNNVNGTLILLDEMRRAGIYRLIFSSSATVYGQYTPVPYTETTSIGNIISPYGTSKFMAEKIINDFVKAEPQFSVIILRYFNPAGAHESGFIGEDPNRTPSNLLAFIAQVAIGRQSSLKIFGNVYPTNDGTCIRDYVHVMDIADGHLKAMDYLLLITGYRVFNLGTGIGYSVMQIIKTFEQISGKIIPYEIVPQREGDLAAFWADTTLAQRELGWSAKRDLNCIVKDIWRWQTKNPNGYK